MSPDLIKTRIKPLFIFLLILSFIEGLITIFSIVSIPTDPKNAFFLGYSINRLLILGVSISFLGILISLFANVNNSLKNIERFISSERVINGIKWAGIIIAICLWFTIWFPADRFGTFAASYFRVKPLLLWFELIVFQVYIFYKLVNIGINFKWPKLKEITDIGILRDSALAIILCVVLFILLGIRDTGTYENQLNFPPGAPLSTLQLFFAWLLFIIIFFFERNKNASSNNKLGLIIVTFLIIWLTASFVWNSTPFYCAEDRPGPYLPNNQCYPAINDAVYSIGSHYITLGQGIYNHWQTDKPLYMIFLAVGQLIAGPRIDQYLTFQVVFLALVPALLFLFGKQFIGFSGGLFLALLSLLIGANEIILYRSVGGVNAKLENPELFTGLFLILLCGSVFNWFIKPNKLVWAAFSGGLLGLLALIRLNPIFILPVLLLAVIVYNYRRKLNPLQEILIFLLSFTLVFSPIILSAKDSQGNIYYLAKVKNVISERYSVAPTTKTDTTEYLAPTQSILEQNTSPIVETTKLTEIPDQSTPEQNTSTQIITQNELNYPSEGLTQSGGISIFFHFLNNEFSSLAILPVNLSFISIDNQVNQPIWEFNNPKLIWESNLSIENIFVLFLNLSVIILGISYSVKYFGFAGISALIIQVGYHLGNAFAKTSGGRYLQPVNWVTLLYFSIGVFVVTSFIISKFNLKKNKLNPLRPEKTVDNNKLSFFPIKKLHFKLFGVLVFFLFIGLSIPLINHLPSLLPEENSSESYELAKMKLEKDYSVSDDQWNIFINDPNHLIVRGKAYNARYYRSSFYQSGNLSFELMLLSEDHVFVNYLLGVQPDKTFADESDVILVGCKIGQDGLWGANRIIMKSFAVIQLDHEQSLYIDPNSIWKCSEK